MRRIHLLPTLDLLPETWRKLAAAGPVRSFNPGLLADGAGWLLAYRIVGIDGLRRIGICRLDAALDPVPGSALPLSDRLQLASGRDYADQVRHWFADPRLYRLDGRLFIQWNSGWHAPMNHQFLQELDAVSLEPLGPARELLLAGERRPIEKNWTLLGDSLGRAIYAPAPHRVLELAAQDSTSLSWRPCHASAWEPGDFPRRYGPLRGGAPPQLRGAHHTSFCHSVFGTSLGYCYVAAVYRFSATAPFGPTAGPARPLRLGLPSRSDLRRESLNPATHRVVYPCGAAWRDAAWLVSYGIDDTDCAIAVLPAAEVEAALRPLSHPPGHTVA
jgi:hypothetical protein